MQRLYLVFYFINVFFISLRWKVFQCLMLEGENAGTNALRNAERFYINEETFNGFLQRHNHVKCLVPESNTKMQNSYLILDEYVSHSSVLISFMHISLFMYLVYTVTLTRPLFQLNSSLELNLVRVSRKVSISKSRPNSQFPLTKFRSQCVFTATKMS